MTKKEEIAELKAKIAEDNRKFINAITDADISPQQKTVELLAFIAEKVLENNEKLEEIHEELFQHTLALDAMSS